MKHNKAFILPFIPLFVASCGTPNYAGLYSFQLGKDNGSHIAINLSLTNDDYEKNPELGKKFSLVLDLGNFNNSDEEESEEASSFSVLDFLGSKITINGFYTVGEVVKDKERKLNVGVTLLEEDKEDGESGETDISDLEIPVELVDDIIFATIIPTQAIFNIPTSINDLVLQLYWYGYDFNIYELSFEEVEAHPHGTHPTADDIKYINETLEYSKSHAEPFRDFHNLSMALARKE